MAVHGRRWAAAIAAAVVAASGLLVPSPAATAGGTPFPAVETSGAGRPAARMHWQPRKPTYAGTVTRSDLPIEMSDGTILRADLVLPADADGQRIRRDFPVVVTITAYNKSALASTGLGGSDPSYLVRRGYAQLTVDARGTGSSEGVWRAFGRREDRDAGEVMTWAHRQPWSNGKTAMSGPSYMGISQIFAAAAQPKGLRAIFPQVPAADVYRDVVVTGGQVDVAFIPLWLGLVTATGLIPPAVGASDPQSALGAYLSHLEGALTFTAPLVPQALLGGEPAYDGAFYDDRSPDRVIDRVEVPTFLVGGQYDIFQRGTPLLFERLQDNGVPTKLVVGPWNHLQASAGTGLEEAGYGTLSQLQLRWFDHYVKDRPDRWLDRDIKALTYYEQGSGRWRTAPDWIGARQHAVQFRLSGDAVTGGASAGALVRRTPEAGSAAVLPIPAAGLCTRSTDQWTAGLASQLPVPNPCLEDSALNDAAGVVFETAPMKRGLSFQGPANARLHVSSLGGDGMLSVAVEDVAPDGTVTRLAGGWQVISFRELDRGRSRYLDGELLQAFHPFTEASKRPLPMGETRPVDVEVFPTGARIAKGHRLRLSVQAFDVPHLLPTLPDLLGSLTVLTVHTGPEHPSVLTLPGV